MIDASKPSDVDYDKAFIKAALESAVNELLVSILNDATKIR